MIMMLALLAASACTSTQVSSNGGIVPLNQEFSMTVPSSCSLKQGSNNTIAVTLNRGAYFKQDVQLDISAVGIDVAPDAILVKASDKPDVQFQIAVSRDAALGDYRVTVVGTPTSGQATTTVFVATVVAQ
jgi:uncharacterized membrane protein